MWKVCKLIFRDLVRNRIILAYLLFLSALGWGIFSIETQPEKAHLMLMQITLLAIPLFTLVFGTIYYYHSVEFILLLLAQPLKRKNIITGLFLSLSAAFITCYILGIAMPLAIFYPYFPSSILIVAGLLLSTIFCGIALLIAILINDKAKGIGIIVLLWTFFAFIFDGFLLYFMYQFAAYPIEKAVMVISFLNPVDTARIMVIMQTDASALMGLSGAVFRNFFGSKWGILISLINLAAWTLIPLRLAMGKFLRKDF